MDFEVSKEVDVDITVTIYDVECKECDALLEFEGKVDDDGDVRLKVEPCLNCIERSWKDVD